LEAAGAHNLLMIGPPGAGKAMLQRTGRDGRPRNCDQHEEQDTQPAVAAVAKLTTEAGLSGIGASRLSTGESAPKTHF
jgi:hypothetical protein